MHTKTKFLGEILSQLFKKILFCFQILSHFFPPRFAFRYLSTFPHLPLLSDTLPPLPTSICFQILRLYHLFPPCFQLLCEGAASSKPQQPGPAPHPLHDFQPFFHKLPTTPTNSSKESQRQLPAFHRFLQQLRRQLGMLVFSLNAGLSFQPKGHLEVTGVFITKIDIFPILAACIILFLNILTICSIFLTKSVQPAVTPCF